jgi:hypothetical protein
MNCLVCSRLYVSLIPEQGANSDCSLIYPAPENVVNINTMRTDTHSYYIIIKNILNKIKCNVLHRAKIKAIMFGSNAMSLN